MFCVAFWSCGRAAVLEDGAVPSAWALGSFSCGIWSLCLVKSSKRGCGSRWPCLFRVTSRLADSTRPDRCRVCVHEGREHVPQGTRAAAVLAASRARTMPPSPGRAQAALVLPGEGPRRVHHQQRPHHVLLLLLSPGRAAGRPVQREPAVAVGAGRARGKDLRERPDDRPGSCLGCCS